MNMLCMLWILQSSLLYIICCILWNICSISGSIFIQISTYSFPTSIYVMLWNPPGNGSAAQPGSRQPLPTDPKSSWPVRSWGATSDHEPKKIDEFSWVIFAPTLQNGWFSKNSGLKPPKSSHFNRVFHYFYPPFWGYHYFWKHLKMDGMFWGFPRPEFHPHNFQGGGVFPYFSGRWQALFLLQGG